MNNSRERCKDRRPAYHVSPFGVFSEVASPETRPLYWEETPLTKDRIKELFHLAEGKPLAFARLIEEEHGICQPTTLN